MTDAPAPPRPERKATLRLGQNQLNAISLGVVLLVIAGLIYGGYLLFLGLKGQRDMVIAKDNLHNIYNALKLYASDSDNKLPAADKWADAAAGYLSATNKPGGKMAYLVGPGDGEDIRYVFNDLASEYDFEPPAAFGQPDKAASKTPVKKTVSADQLVLLIERPGAPLDAHEIIPYADTMEGRRQLSDHLRFPHDSSNPDRARTIVLFADGHIVEYTRKDLKY